MLTRHCPLKRKDYSSEGDFQKAIAKYINEIIDKGYNILSYPNANGYFYVERVEKKQ